MGCEIQSIGFGYIDGMEHDRVGKEEKQWLEEGGPLKEVVAEKDGCYSNYKEKKEDCSSSGWRRRREAVGSGGARPSS